MSHILDILHERGFIKQIMGEDKLGRSNAELAIAVGSKIATDSSG